MSVDKAFRMNRLLVAGMFLLPASALFAQTAEPVQAASDATETIVAKVPKARTVGEMTAVLLVDVDAQGRPFNIMIEHTTGSKDIDRIAINAAKKWHFKPEQSDGRSVPTRIRVPVSFETN